MSGRLVTLAALAAVCAALALSAGGCSRDAARDERPGAGAVAGARRADDAAAVRVSAGGTAAAEPAAATARDGSVYVAWVEHKGKEADVWLAHFDGEARPAGQPVRVNPNAGEATAWRGDPPSLAVAPDGTVYVVWTARDASAPHATTLYLSASRDGGRGFGPPSKVNDDAKPGDHGMHSLAVAGDGRVYVAWLDERDSAPKEADPAKAPSHMEGESNRFAYFAASADGGRTFSRNRRLADEVCPCCKTSLAAADDGRVYVSWRQVLPGNLRHIAVASSADGGQSFSPPTVVSDDRWELQGCPVSGPALAASGGSLRVLWYTAGGAGAAGLYWSESTDGGRTFSPRRPLAAEAAGRGTPVLLKGEGGGLVAVWEGAEGGRPVTLAARLDPEGREAPAKVVAQGAQLPSAAPTAGGQFFVAYVGKEGEASDVRLARVRAE